MVRGRGEGGGSSCRRIEEQEELKDEEQKHKYGQ